MKRLVLLIQITPAQCSYRLLQSQTSACCSRPPNQRFAFHIRLAEPTSSENVFFVISPFNFTTLSAHSASAKVLIRESRMDLTPATTRAKKLRSDTALGCATTGLAENFGGSAEEMQEAVAADSETPAAATADSETPAAATADSETPAAATATTSSAANDRTTMMNVFFCFVDSNSGGRWFKLPADVDSSKTVLRPKYLPDGPCYERQPVTALWQKMTDVTMKQWQWRTYKQNNGSLTSSELSTTPRRLLEVFGPPGSGKSTAAYAWMWYTCFMANCKALWIECTQSVDAVGGTSKGWCLSRERGKVDVTPITWTGKPTLQELHDLGADIVIFDGMREATQGGWGEQLTTLCEEGVAVIIVASEGVSLPEGEIDPIVEIKYRVPSWTLEEYYAACANDTFWKNVYRFVGGLSTLSGEGRNMAIENKYLMAGHSARFMFRRDSEAVRITINMASAKLANINSLKDALGAWAHSHSVNKLMAWLWQNGATLPTQALFPTHDDLTAAISDLSLLDTTKGEFWSEESQSKGNVFVSRHALQAVLNRITKKVDQMKGIADSLNQPAILGYALELRFLELLNNHANDAKNGIEVYQSSSAGSAQRELWLVGHVARDSSNLLSSIEGVEVDQRNNAWIWVGGNVTGFDAVHIFTQDDEHWIRFVQVTAAEKHSLKLFAVEDALQQLAHKGFGFPRVDFVFVRPTDDKRKFYVEPAVGGLKSGDWKTFGGHPWRESSDPRKLVVEYGVNW
jgi:hypothetical protein